MTFIFALTIGILYAASFYMILRRSLVQMVIGLILVSHASNLLIFSCGGLRGGGVPIIQDATAPMMPDPLPQALILTAIVISFGVLAFSLVLTYRSYRLSQSEDPDVMKEGEL